MLPEWIKSAREILGHDNLSDVRKYEYHKSVRDDGVQYIREILLALRLADESYVDLMIERQFSIGDSHERWRLLRTEADTQREE